MAEGTITSRKTEVLVFDQVSPVVLQGLPAERYTVVKASSAPDVILLRSRDLHAYDFGAEVMAVGRAGAGVNNIPVPKLTARGIPVFNAPGANANAVKELVLVGMLMAARAISAGRSSLCGRLTPGRRISASASRRARRPSRASNCRGKRSA